MDIVSLPLSLRLVLTPLLDTATIASRGGWLYCDDSSVKPIDAKQVVVSRSPYQCYKVVHTTCTGSTCICLVLQEDEVDFDSNYYNQILTLLLLHSPSVHFAMLSSVL